MRFNRTIQIVALTNVVSGFSRYPLWILLALYLSVYRHVSDLDIALIFLASAAVTSPFSIYGGRFADRSGRRPLLLGVILAMVGGYALLFVSVSFNLAIALIVFALVVISVLNNLEYVGVSAVVTDVSTEEQRLDFFSLQRVTGNAGIGAGLVLAGISSEVYPSLFFLIPALGAVVEFLLYWRWVPESRQEGEALPQGGRSWFRALRDRRLVVIALLLPLAFLVANQWETPMMPLYLTGRFGIPVAFITLLYAVNTVTVVATQFLANRVPDRMGEGVAFSIGLVLYAVSDAVFWATGNIALLAANVVLLTTGENLTSPYAQVIVSRIAPADRRGEYFGASQLIAGVIGPFSPFVGTFMLGYFAGALYWMWGFLAGACLTLAVVFLPVHRWLERQRPAPSPPWTVS